jgi:hypothetical protein
VAHVDHFDGVLVEPFHKFGLEALIDLSVGKFEDRICDLVLDVGVIRILDHPTLVLQVYVNELLQIWREETIQDRCIKLSQIQWSLSQSLNELEIVEFAGEVL